MGQIIDKAKGQIKPSAGAMASQAIGGEGCEPTGCVLRRPYAGAQRRFLSRPGGQSALRRVAAIRSALRGNGKPGLLHTRSHPASMDSLLVLSDVHLGSDLNDFGHPIRRSRSVDDDLVKLITHYRAVAPPSRPLAPRRRRRLHRLRRDGGAGRGSGVGDGAQRRGAQARPRQRRRPRSRQAAVGRRAPSRRVRRARRLRGRWARAHVRPRQPRSRVPLGRREGRPPLAALCAGVCRADRRDRRLRVRPRESRSIHGFSTLQGSRTSSTGTSTMPSARASTSWRLSRGGSTPHRAQRLGRAPALRRSADPRHARVRARQARRRALPRVRHEAGCGRAAAACSALRERGRRALSTSP